MCWTDVRGRFDWSEVGASCASLRLDVGVDVDAIGELPREGGGDGGNVGGINGAETAAFRIWKKGEWMEVSGTTTRTSLQVVL